MSETDAVNRRELLQRAGIFAGVLASSLSRADERASPALSRPEEGLQWKRQQPSGLFTSVVCDGKALVASPTPGLLDGRCRLAGEPLERASRLSAHRSVAEHGPLRLELRHALLRSDPGAGEDVLQATLTARNTSSRDVDVEVAFATSVQPPPVDGDQAVYLPLGAAGLAGDRRFEALGVQEFRKDCQQPLGRDGFECHYLEPMASYPDERRTRALLLAPVVEIGLPPQAWHVALFTPSDQPRKFSSMIAAGGRRLWETGRMLTVPAGEEVHQRCWLMVHRGDASVAWRAFHRFAHEEDQPRIDWVHGFKVHYYDFLSSAAGKNGHRGDGYEAALPLFRELHVGLATQHGYYPSLGDYIHPDRKTWSAMRGDPQGPAEMSLARIAERIRATRAAGARAAIYIHPVLFDEATPFFASMRDSVLVDEQGQMVPFPWKGPDTVGTNWRASLASPEWREHLLQQVDWIMDLLRPDAIAVDETFAGIGYDHHPHHAGPTSLAAIDWHRRLRAIVRSHGQQKAVFSSDCSRSPFALWCDGEVGDHAYPSSLGNPLYRQEPVRYLAALGAKPWRPCAWDFRRMWKHQMALARQVGAGVGVSNGWIEYCGLHGLPREERAAMIADIESLG